MQDWENKLNEFLRFNDRQVLHGAGKVSKKEADEAAIGEYEQYVVNRYHQLNRRRRHSKIELKLLAETLFHRDFGRSKVSERLCRVVYYLEL